MFGKKKQERKAKYAAEKVRWEGLSNLEKAMEALEAGRRQAFAPASTSLLTEALCYLLLEHFDREDRSYRRPHERSPS